MEIDQNKSMSVRDLDPQEEGRVRLEPNGELQKVHMGLLLKSSHSLDVDY